MSISNRQPRPKRCQNDDCGQEFVPRFSSMQKVCSPACALATKDKYQAPARKAIADRQRREVKARKEKLKSRADHLKETQQAFNEYIRLRDADKPCISCDRHHQGKYDAGHYRSVGACPELRFDEDNVHKQCSPCNTQLSGNILEYRIRLIQRIGADRVARLEGKHEPLKLSVEQIKALKAHFRAKVRELKRGAA